MNVRKGADVVARTLAQPIRSMSLIREAPFGLRYGPPGRSANSGITATVFGANGFVGKYFIDELGAYCIFHFVWNCVAFLIHDEGMTLFVSWFVANMYAGKRGSRVYVPYRGCEMEIRHLKPMFDLGQVCHLSHFKYFVALVLFWCLC